MLGRLLIAHFHKVCRNSSSVKSLQRALIKTRFFTCAEGDEDTLKVVHLSFEASKYARLGEFRSERVVPVTGVEFSGVELSPPKVGLWYTL